MTAPISGMSRSFAVSFFGPHDESKFRSTDFHVKGNGSFVTFSRLKLHGVAFIEVFDLGPRGETAAMEENFIAAVIRNNEAVTLLTDYFFDRSGHVQFPPVVEISSKTRNQISPRAGPETAEGVEMTIQMEDTVKAVTDNCKSMI
jgi:hypothetical protein